MHCSRTGACWLCVWQAHAHARARAHAGVSDPLEQVSSAYYARLVSNVRYNPPALNAAAPRVVYTPLHGVGADYVKQAFKVCAWRGIGREGGRGDARRPRRQSPASPEAPVAWQLAARGTGSARRIAPRRAALHARSFCACAHTRERMHACVLACGRPQAMQLPEPHAVPQQAAPDPEFPTVVFPNPEEGKGVWTLSFEAGEAVAGADRRRTRMRSECVAWVGSWPAQHPAKLASSAVKPGGLPPCRRAGLGARAWPFTHGPAACIHALHAPGGAGHCRACPKRCALSHSACHACIRQLRAWGVSANLLISLTAPCMTHAACGFAHPVHQAHPT